MSALTQMSADLDWREGELATIKLLLLSAARSDIQKQVLLRAAWALLYAHFEGYVKFCLTVFYDEVAKKKIPRSELPPSTLAFCLSEWIKQLRQQSKMQVVDQVKLYHTDLAGTSADFPEVDTKSNLWPVVLKELLESADISLPSINLHERKLSTLVARRNSIAHGEKNFIAEISYYLTFESAAYEVMYELAYEVDRRLTTVPYEN